MRIIEKEKEKHITCPTCKTKIGFYREDVRQIGSWHKQDFIYCLVCHERISISHGCALDSLGGLK